MHSELDSHIDNEKMDGWKSLNWRWEKEENIFFVNKDYLLVHNFWIYLQSGYTNIPYSKPKDPPHREMLHISRVTHNMPNENSITRD